jgi:hypothetical protein
VSSPHPIKPGLVPSPATTPPSVPRFSTRPVHPFSLSCEFNRQRGQFVVLAGARAGACAVVTAAVLAIGTFGFVRSSLFGHGPSAASAAVTPPLSSIATATTTTTPTPTKAAVKEPSSKAKSSSAKAAKSTKSAKAETPVASSSPAVARTIQHHTPAEPQRKLEHKAERRRAGLNYLVMLTLRTKASAEKARETLLRKGVATTVERSLPGLSVQRKYSLVGLTGFEPDSEQSKLERQVKRLKALKLDPKPYTWGG